jgi:serine/threonine-protein kinase ULK2
VAIKSVNLTKLNKKLRENLTSEISILKGLHHPHIVALIDCKESTSHIHLVMEYVALGDLSHFIKKRESVQNNTDLVGNMFLKYPNPANGGLHEVVVRHFLQQLASALQFLRAKNLIHRDVKPQNLLLNPSPVYFERKKPHVMPYCASEASLIPVCGIRSLPMLKIADFGFARALPPTSLAETLCGSPLYMAPEILRFEKYDAKADLWSVGTVLFEMVTAKPPFRAANHVDLLRKIERQDDRLKFGDEVIVSSGMKQLIRALLKRDPRQRISFPDFFAHEVVAGDIPGLAQEDLHHGGTQEQNGSVPQRRLSSRTDPTSLAKPGPRREPESPYSDHNRAVSDEYTSSSAPRRPSHASRQPSITSRTQVERRTSTDNSGTHTEARPRLASHVTAPGRQELQQNHPSHTSTAMARQGSGSGRPPSSLRNEITDDEEGRLHRRQMEQDITAQDIAFERDYVVVEKQQIVVNAFADEMAASPRVKPGTTPSSLSPKSGAMVRRATTQGYPTPSAGVQTNASRAAQAAAGKSAHSRGNSHDQRYGPNPMSATSAITKAINMAGGRILSLGFSPPVNFMRGGKSPQSGYNAFPAYPGTSSSLVLVGDSSAVVPANEDLRIVKMVEAVATRSDVAYGFAEVKYQQLIPSAPSATATGLGLRDADSEDQAVRRGELEPSATVKVSSEALVLYVKALALLAKSIHLAARWWNSKRQSAGDSTPTKTAAVAQQRMNNVVQWARSRFNEVLEKTDYARLKLIENQKMLPEDHASHPSNLAADAVSGTGMGSSADDVFIDPTITAENLMYTRASEMSKSAAMSELIGDDLPGCEISYVTAILMFEAVLEDEEDLSKSDPLAGDENAVLLGTKVTRQYAIKGMYILHCAVSCTD